MRKVVVSTFATLDGRVSELQDWGRPFDEEAQVEYHDGLLANADGLILGRKTYQIFAGLWPARAGVLEYADKINALPKYVASTSLTQLDWNNSSLLSNDVCAAVSDLMRGGDGDLVVYGGQRLIRALLAYHLVDEYRVLFSPVLLGQGALLHDEGAPRVNMEHLETSVVHPGIVVASYRPQP